MNTTHQPSWQKKTIIFLVSQCITLFGSTLVQMAIVWYATMQTASGIWVAAFTIAAYLPQFLVSFFGGVWADRYNRKYLIIGADAGISVITFIMVLAIPNIHEELVLLLGLLIMSVLRSVGAGIQAPAVNAVIPQLVPTEQLMRYNGINATMQSIVNFAAPTAAGAIFEVGNLQTTLMIDIVTAVIGIGLFCSITLPKVIPSTEKKSILTDMKLGLHYAFSHKFIGRLLLTYGIFTFLCVPAGFLAGLLVRRVFGNTYWYLTAVELVGFGGMIIGGLLMSSWGGFQSRIKTLVVGLSFFGIFAICMGLSQDFILYLTFMLFYGVALTMVQTVITTLLQERTDSAVQGRVFGLLNTMYSGFLPIGMAFFGPIADVVPLQTIIVVSGGLLIVLAYISRQFH